MPHNVIEEQNELLTIVNLKKEIVVNKLITYMWRDVSYEDIYSFQTNDPDVIKRMKDRHDFWQVGYGGILVFKTRKKTPQSARRTLGRITRGIVKKDTKNDVWYAESNTIVGTKTKPEFNNRMK